MSVSNKVFNSSLVPGDAMAGRTMRKGVQFEPKKIAPEGHVDQRTPHSMRPAQDVHQHLRYLIGIRFGRLTVIGSSAEKRGRWVVRCACGMYTLRNKAAITNLKNDQDCCATCMAVVQMKRREIARRTGKGVRVQDVPGACPPRTELRPDKKPKKHAGKPNQPGRAGGGSKNGGTAAPTALSLAFQAAMNPSKGNIKSR